MRVLGKEGDLTPAIRASASKMLARDDVQAYLRELQNAAKDAHLVTVESIAAELDHAKDFAQLCGNAGAMVSAITTKAKLYGLLTDKVKAETTGSMTISWLPAQE